MQIDIGFGDTIKETTRGRLRASGFKAKLLSALGAAPTQFGGIGQLIGAIKHPAGWTLEELATCKQNEN